MHGFSLRREMRPYMKCSGLWSLPKEKTYISPTQNVDKEMTNLYSVQERYPTAHPGSDF